MKRTLLASTFAILLHIGAPFAFAGPSKIPVIVDPSPFYESQRPVTNPVYFDLAVPRTKIQAL
ncbi:MAG: hypothetical protein AAF357_16935, partial [Verrucomicrobiota bacterium]